MGGGGGGGACGCVAGNINCKIDVMATFQASASAIVSAAQSSDLVAANTEKQSSARGREDPLRVANFQNAGVECPVTTLLSDSNTTRFEPIIGLRKDDFVRLGVLLARGRERE